VDVQLHAFLTSALDGGEWSASRPGRFTHREGTPGTHWIGGWVGPRAVLDAVVKRKISSPCRESNSRTLIVQPYTDWAITAITDRHGNLNSKISCSSNRSSGECLGTALRYPQFSPVLKTLHCPKKALMSPLWPCHATPPPLLAPVNCEEFPS
jgi:hypothetical protein